jgi:alginate O-acetyltransferase complex protein AlgJ
MRTDGPVEQPAATSRRTSLEAATRLSRRPSKVFFKVGAEPARTKGWKDKALIAIFLVAISFPLVGSTFHLDTAITLAENRRLASRPELKLDPTALAEFPARFEAYFNDQFGFRRLLIQWQNLIKVAVLGVSPSPKVILGKNGWLYYGDIELDYYRAIKPLTPKQLDDWRGLFESRRDWLLSRGIPYLVVIAPNKSTLYPEYMPASYNRLPRESRLDQLMAYLRSRSSLKVVDLRPSLYAAKSREQVYYRTDSHWNNRGAYAGYTTIVRALTEWFPDFRAIPRSEFGEFKVSEPGRDLALLLGMRDYYWDEYFDIKRMTPSLAQETHEVDDPPAPPPKPWRSGPNFVFEHPDKKLPRAVVFRDSFATWLMPLLSEHFQRVVFCWQYILDKELVEQEHPDVVIQEMVERTLMASPMDLR